MAITEKKLLEILLADGSQPGERENALSLLKRTTGLDRESLVEKYLKPKAARSTNKKTKLELEQDLMVAYRAVARLQGQLQSALKQIEILRASPRTVKDPRKTLIHPRWKILIYSTIIVVVQWTPGSLSIGSLFSMWLGIILVIIATVLIMAKEVQGE